MKIALSIISLLILSGISYAEQPKVYGDQDLQKYNNPSDPSSSSQKTYRSDRNTEQRREEYIDEMSKRNNDEYKYLARKALEVIADTSMSEKEKCSTLLEIHERQGSMLRASSNPTPEAVAGHATIGNSLKVRCQRYR